MAAESLLQAVAGVQALPAVLARVVVGLAVVGLAAAEAAVAVEAAAEAEAEAEAVAVEVGRWRRRRRPAVVIVAVVVAVIVVVVGSLERARVVPRRGRLRRALCPPNRHERHPDEPEAEDPRDAVPEGPSHALPRL